jgi:hypothetical protein
MDKETKNKNEVNIKLFLPLLFLYISLPFISNKIIIGIIFILIFIAIIRTQVFIEQEESQNKGV